MALLHKLWPWSFFHVDWLHYRGCWCFCKQLLGVPSSCNEVFVWCTVYLVAKLKTLKNWSCSFSALFKSFSQLVLAWLYWCRENLKRFIKVSEEPCITWLLFRFAFFVFNFYFVKKDGNCKFVDVSKHARVCVCEGMNVCGWDCMCEGCWEKKNLNCL